MDIIHEENIVFISVIFMDIFTSAYPWGPLKFVAIYVTTAGGDRITSYEGLS